MDWKMGGEDGGRHCKSLLKDMDFAGTVNSKVLATVLYMSDSYVTQSVKPEHVQTMFSLVLVLGILLFLLLTLFQNIFIS